MTNKQLALPKSALLIQLERCRLAREIHWARYLCRLTVVMGSATSLVFHNVVIILICIAVKRPNCIFNLRPNFMDLSTESSLAKKAQKKKDEHFNRPTKKRSFYFHCCRAVAQRNKCHHQQKQPAIDWKMPIIIKRWKRKKKNGYDNKWILTTADAVIAADGCGFCCCCCCWGIWYWCCRHVAIISVRWLVLLFFSTPIMFCRVSVVLVNALTP